MADGVPDRGKPEPDHTRVACLVDHLVDPAGDEGCIHGDAGRLRRRARRVDIAKAPGRTRDPVSLATRLVPPGQCGFGVVEIDRWIALGVTPHEWSGQGGLIENKLRRHRPSQGVTTTSRCRGGEIDQEAGGAGDHVPVPGTPEEGVALLEQKAVAGVIDGPWVVAARRKIEHRQHAETASIVDLVEQRAVTALGIERTKQDEVACKGDQTTLVDRRQFEIDDHGVCGLFGVDGVVQSSLDTLISAGLAEHLATGKRLSHQDLQPLDRGRERRCDRQQSGKKR